MKLVLSLLLPLTILAQDTLREPWTVGVALSGGAALGLAHVGVLKVLEEEGIPISYISGTSMGSIVGGMYAAGYSAHDMDSILTTVDWQTLFSERIPDRRMTLARREEGYRNILEIRHRWFIPNVPSGVISLENVEILLTELLEEASYDAGYNFDSLVIPFRCVGVDVVSGEAVVFRQGSLVDAIRASIAIPAVFEPAEVEGRSYIDGGAMMNLPVEPLLEFKPDFIIASDVIRWTPQARSLIDVVTRTMAIVTESNRREQRKLSSIVLYPNVDRFLPSDFGRAEELVAAGEVTARLAMPAMRQRFEAHPLVLKRNALRPRPKPMVTEVKLEGLNVTKESVVRHQIYTDSGDTLDFKLLVADLERLRETELFDHVSHRLEFPDSAHVNVVFTLKEKNYGIYGFGAYYDNVHGFAVRLEIAQSNLLGLGAKVSLSTVLGEPRDWRLGIRGARLGLLPFTYRLEAYINRARLFGYYQQTEPYEYLVWARGADAELGYALGKQTYFTLGYQLRYYFYQLPPLPGEENSKELATGPTFRFRASSLDNLVFPRRGLDLELGAKWGLPTSTFPRQFVRLQAQAERYFPFGDRVVLGLGAGYGLGFDTLPRGEKFLLGGDNLTGAREDSYQVQEYIKGRVLLGYRFFDFLNNPRYPVRLELTADIAMLNPFVYGSFPDFEAFMGVGVGAAGNTPLGPIRATVGISSARQLSFRIAVGIPPQKLM